MRTFEEIKADIDRALLSNDVDVLRPLADEMKARATPNAQAVSLHALASAERLTGNSTLSLEYFRQALTLKEELGDRSGVASINNNMGLAFHDIGDYAAALEHYRLALDLYNELGDRAGAANVESNLGHALQSIGEYEQAIQYHRRALSLNEELDNRKGIAIALDSIGNIYGTTGDFAAAMEHMRRALALHEDLGNRRAVARVMGNIANVYYFTGDYPSALDLYRQALALHEDLGDRKGIADVTGNMGSVYYSTGEYSTTLEYLHRSLRIREELDDKAGIALTSGNIGSVHQTTGDFAEALTSLRRALALYQEQGNRAGVASITNNIVGTLLGSGNIPDAVALLEGQAAMQMQNPRTRAEYLVNRARVAEHSEDLDAAHAYLKQALEIVDTAGVRFFIADLHKSLRDLAQKRNDFAGYIEHNNEYSRITEEIKGKEATQKLAMMEAERKAEAVERERVKERALLYGALPESVATRMLRGEDVSGDQYDSVSVLFLDIAGFTTISDHIPPGHVVHLLKTIFTSCDDVCKRHGVTKIKTIGDSYMAVSFPNTENQTPKTTDASADVQHIVSAARSAVEMLAALNALEVTMPPELGDTSWTKEIGDIKVRIGIHCGPVTAGVIGTERLQYDVWGDTVNVASRMESHGEPGRIHVSEAFATALQLNDSLTDDSMTLFKRGEVSIKGKGPMITYWLEETRS